MVDFDTSAKSDFRAVKILVCEAVPKSKKLLKFTLDDGERKDFDSFRWIIIWYFTKQMMKLK